MKRTYELMLVLKPEVEAKDTKKIGDIVKKLLSDAAYTVTKTDIMGKKFLAYPIKKFKDGLYVLHTLESDGLTVGSIEARAKLEPSVLRYLLTRVTA